MIEKKEHQPIMVEEVLTGLAVKPQGFYVDLTFGRGGHSQAMLKVLGADGRLIAVDRDPTAIDSAQRPPFLEDPRFRIQQTSFSGLKELMQECGWMGRVDGILMDLGVSSPQLDRAERGFSFMRDGPLDMRMNPDEGMDAATWLNTAKPEEIAKVLWRYGEERFSRRIVNAIVEQRPLTSTLQLANLIAEAVPIKEKHKHPATRSFQAIRIFINNELGELEAVLQDSVDVLATGGRLCVISFHSLEDRMVKRFIAKESKGESYPRHFPIKDADIHRRLKKVGGLIRSTDEELNDNVRARSARLRIAEKIA